MTTFAFLNVLRPLVGRSVDFDALLEVIRFKAKLLVRSAPAAAAFAKKPKPGQPETVPADLPFFSIKRSWMALFTTVFLGLFLAIFQDLTLAMIIVFSAGFVLQFLNTITSLPVLVLDVRDATLLATQPLSAATLSLARSLLLWLDQSVSTALLYSGPLIVLVATGKLAVVPGFLLAVLLSGLLCVAIAYLVYGLVLRFSDGEKLKDLISALQVILSIVTMVGYQFISRMTGLMNAEWNNELVAWHLLVPPLDLARIAVASDLVPALASLAAVLGFLALHVLVTGRLVEANLNKLLAHGERTRWGYQLKQRAWDGLGNLLLRTPSGRAFFSLAFSMVSNDRKLKQALYPGLASAYVLPAILWFSFGMPRADWVVFLVYGTFIAHPTLAFLARTSSQPQSTDRFELLPSEGPARAWAATTLHVMLRYALVPQILFSAFLILWLGPSAVVGALVAVAGAWLSAQLALRLVPSPWPWSESVGSTPPGAGRAFFGWLGMATVLVGLTYIASLFGPWGLAGFGVVELVVGAALTIHGTNHLGLAARKD